MTVPESRLIDRLVADAAPVHPLWPLRIRLGIWLLLEVAVVTALVLFLPDTVIGPAAPVRTIETIYLVTASAVLATIALAAAVPGRAEGPRLPLIVGALAVAAALPALAEPAHGEMSLSGLLVDGISCSLKTLAVSLLPGLGLLLAVRRGAALRPGLAAAAASGAALILGHAALRLACPMHDLLHVVLWHVGAVWIGLLIGARVGARWIARWRG
jgi:hypothetical protein